jgi:hypothetical protein
MKGTQESGTPCTAGRFAMRAVMATFYLAAGIVHLTAPDAFLPIVPTGFHGRVTSF